MFFLKVDPKDVITDVRWKTYGCASAISLHLHASARSSRALSIREAYQLKPEDVSKRLGGLPDNKIHRSVLGDKALRVRHRRISRQDGPGGAFKDLGATVICTRLNITDRDIEQAVKEGARTWEGLQERTKIGTVCGGCKGRAEDLLVEYVHVFGHDEQRSGPGRRGPTMTLSAPEIAEFRAGVLGHFREEGRDFPGGAPGIPG
ncbi:MAG: iron-sulfur cluster assembly scaffold protein [Desulfobacterales bacterium]|nr:iron-sulfur cluster assembly scaffold protein [Desulfobacterales bacterium]